MKLRFHRALAVAAFSLLLSSAAAAQQRPTAANAAATPACTQSMLTGNWMLEIVLVRGYVHGCAISIDAKGNFQSTGCKSPSTHPLAKRPAGVLSVGPECRVIGGFCYSEDPADSCGTQVSLSTQDSLMWMSNDATRVSGFGRGKVTSSGGDLGVVPLELISKAPKVP